MADVYFQEFLRPPTVEKATGLKRIAGLAVRGATLGALGASAPAETIGEAVTEFAGSIPTIVGISALTSPLVGGAVRAARVPAIAVPTVSRLAGAGATGATVGGVEALARGESVPGGAAVGAGTFVAGEGAFLAGARAVRALRAPKVKPSEPAPGTPTVVAKAQADAIDQATRVTPETPPVQLEIPGTQQLQIEFRQEPPMNVRDKVVPRFEDVARAAEERRQYPMWEAGVSDVGIEDMFPQKGGVQVGSIAVRRGPVTEEGAYFSTPGASTYYDPESKGGTVYDIAGLKLVDTDNRKVARRVLTEALKDPTNTPEDIKRLRDAIKVGFVDYKLNDEVPSVVNAGKRLGFDGIKVFESDDIDVPSSVFVWNTNKVKAVGPTGPAWFDAAVDNETGIVTYTPKTSAVDAIIERMKIARAEQSNLPLGPEQTTFLQSGDGQGVLRKLDVAGARESKIAEIASRPSDEADKIAEQMTPDKFMDMLKVDLTPDALAVENIIKKLGIDRSAVGQIQAEAAKMSDPLLRSNFIREQLRGLCG